ncbi:MAG: beta-galactosidase [Candidatus Aureabacteria bacterium]|nr:beta-galactosidase [Candidatus Auribacterota bacterium]
MGVKGKKQICIKKGVFYKDGIPFILLSADYPYYRDSRHIWSKKLDLLKEMGVNTVTFYVPWRHHSYFPGEYDFKGQTVPNTDVIRFIDLIAQKGLYCIVKPGPLIHAETNYAGLPDYVEPAAENRIEPMRNAKGEPAIWHKPLPAPLNETFHEHIKNWLNAFSGHVVQGRQYPEGPVIGVQLLNEGIYTFCPPEITGYDYSRSGSGEFSKFLKSKYRIIREYNSKNGTKIRNFEEVFPPENFECKDIRSIRKNIDWAQFSGVFYKEVLSKCSSYMPGTSVPLVVNWNPLSTNCADTFFSRSDFSVFGDIASWGFTNWTKYPYKDEESYIKYQIMAGKHPGVCLEENWGFSKIYDKIFGSSIPSFYQSMLYFAYGAKGMNYYTGVATDSWDINIDSYHEKPYPASAPVSANSEKTDKFYTASLINEFFSNCSPNAVESKVEYDVFWGCYMPYAWAASWRAESEKWQKAGIKAKPECIETGLIPLMLEADKRMSKVGIKYLVNEKVSELLEADKIVLKLSDWMDKNTQAKLVNYVKSGGKLFIYGTVPYLKDDFKPCSVMMSAIKLKKEEIGKAFEKKIGRGRIVFYPGPILKNEKLISSILGSRPKKTPGFDVVKSRNKETRLIYFISRDEKTSSFFEKIGREMLEITGVPGGASVARVKKGKIEGFLIKGINDLKKNTVAPSLKFGDWGISLSKGGDMVVNLSGKQMEVSVLCDVENVSMKVQPGKLKPAKVLKKSRNITEEVKVIKTRESFSFGVESLKKGFKYEIIFK